MGLIGLILGLTGLTLSLADIRPLRDELRLMTRGEGKDGLKDVNNEFAPVFFMTFALWGSCPRKREQVTRVTTSLQTGGQGHQPPDLPKPHLLTPLLTHTRT